MRIARKCYTGRLSLALAAVLALVATTSQASSFVHPGSFGGARFGGAHFAHGVIHGAPGFRFASGGRFAFGGFHHHGLGQFYGPFGAFGLGDLGYSAPGLAYPGFYGPSGLDADEPMAASLATGGYGGSAGPAPGYYGDCQIHQLIYNQNGRYIGQKVIQACDRGL